MKRILPLGLGCLALLSAACGGGVANDALAHENPSQVLASALRATTTSGSLHYELVTGGSASPQSIVGDASATEGRQVISMGTIDIQAELIGKTVYIEGNAGGLENEMGFSSSQAGTYAGRWISLTATDAPYSAVSRAVTLPTALTELEPTGHLTLTPTTTRAGLPAVGVRGAIPGTGSSGTGNSGTIVLYVSTARPTVPLVFDGQATSGGHNETDVGTFSRWGKAFHLSVPVGAVAFSTLRAG